MKRILRCFLFAAACFSLGASSAPASFAGPLHGGRTEEPGPGGDVLRPSRASAESGWALGLDAGLTYAMFQNGPVSFYSPNPFPLMPRGLLGVSMQSTVDEGNGFGFYVGGTADYSVNHWFGIQAKLNYHQRKGVFDRNTDLGEVHPDTQTGLTTILRDEVDWTFNYLGIDLLARIQIADDTWYILIGPSFNSLLSNKAKLTQTIIQPDDIFYYEQPTAPYVINNYQQAQTNSEVKGFESLHVDVKAGIGGWFPLSDNLYFTPELCLSYPISKLVKSDHVDNFAPDVAAEPSAIFWRLNPDIGNDKDFNMVTVTFTLGLRWKL